MSQLIVNIMAAPPTGTAATNSIGPSTEADLSAEDPRIDAGPESAFAAVLQSRIDKKSAPADLSDSIDSSAKAAKADSDETVLSVDLSVLLPLLAANQAAAPSGVAVAATASATGSADGSLTEVRPFDKQASGHAAAAIMASLTASDTASAAVPAMQIAAQSSASPVADKAVAAGLTAAIAMPMAETAAATLGTVLTSPPPSAVLPVRDPAIETPAIPGAAAEAAAILTRPSDSAPLRENVDAQDESLASPQRGPAGPTAQMAGKAAPDAAINAAAGTKHGETNGPALPTQEFHVLVDGAAARMAAASSASIVNGGSAPVAMVINTPLGQPGWHHEIGQQVTWMVGHNHQQADLVLNPPQFGRIEVSLTINGDQATAVFASANPAVREMLEGSLYRLREVLADVGVSLGQTQVGSESPHQSSHRNGLAAGTDEKLRYASDMIPVPRMPQSVVRAGSGLSIIDVFA